jgi:LacI family transcriptional regulator
MFIWNGVVILKYIRLKDIAEKAHVSVNTVSRALKSKSDIGKETSQRIRKIAKELGYVPHAAAVSLRSKTTKTIGVIVTYLDNPFYARILKGITAALSKYGYTPMTWENNEEIEKEKHVLTILTSYRVAGSLIVPASNLENDFDYDTLKMPHLTIVRKANLNTKSYFVVNSFKSGRIVANHFLQTGRKKPAFLGLDFRVSCESDRLSGYRARLAEEGLVLHDTNIHKCFPSSQAAYQTIKTWMKDKPDFDAIFVSTDQLAFGVLRAFYDLGVKVPDDIAVVGHDDVENAQFSTPSLTTVRVPKYKLGFKSAECLINMIQNNEKASTHQTIYEPELIVRESSC